MELHTLGVKGGYTQDDVINVARCFTGWTVRDPEQPEFIFAPFMHDMGEKTVLGHKIPAGRGEEDGLARHRYPRAVTPLQRNLFRVNSRSASSPTILPKPWWIAWRRLS